MVLPGLLTLWLAAVPPGPLAASRVTVTGIYNQKGETYLELASAELRAAGLQVLSPAQALERLGPEEGERLLGCKFPREDCAAELGKALGVRGVLVGALARVPGKDGHDVWLQLLSAEDGRALASTFEGGVDEGDLKAAMKRAARLLATELTGEGADRLETAPVVHAFTTSPILRKIAWGTLAFTGAAAATTAVAVLHRIELLDYPRPEHPLAGSIEQMRFETEQLRQLAVAAAVITGVSLFAWGIVMDLGLQQRPVTPVFALLPGGGAVGLTLAF